MLFNSIDFAIFLPLVFCIYWFIFKKDLRIQNAFLVLVSYVFYGWWDYRFLSLIIASTIVDFVVAKLIHKHQKKGKKKLFVIVSLVFNLGILGFFKYYNFFIENWIDAWNALGISMSVSSLNIILPVGISFYTFQTLSYTLDVYKEKINPTKDIVEFAAYVSFFPQLVAGPIERATSLLPQFRKVRSFDYSLAISGLHLIIWGLFKKVVVADNCAFIVNQIFNAPDSYVAIELWIGAILFGLQIYGDFSGYSDIAIGIARLFGFDLRTNFRFPYFSRNIAEFWRRWHISLSTWFRDYLYIPLGGSRVSVFKKIRNVFIVFVVSGFWHGANWTFIFWGLIHAILFIPLLITKKNRNYLESTKVRLGQLPSILLTFLLTSIAWIFFRSESVTMAFSYIYNMFGFYESTVSVFSSSKMLLVLCIVIVSIAFTTIIEWRANQQNYKEVKLNRFLAVVVILFITFMGVFKNPNDFIYFQF